MSSFIIHEKEFRGFIKIYWACREHPYHNKRMSPANKPFARFCGRHKRSGASYGCSFKQFDVGRHKVYNKFRGRKSVPYEYTMPNTVWGFGKGGGKVLAFNTKFQY